jgi:hypothetical protein
MFALLNNQGTAASETALCAEHFEDADARAEVVFVSGSDVIIPQEFQEIFFNPELKCRICGASDERSYESPVFIAAPK